MRNKSLSQGILSFLLLSKNLKGRSVPRVSHVFGPLTDFVVSLFLDTFRIQGILSFSCFWTLSVISDPLSHVQGRFPCFLTLYSMDLVIVCLSQKSLFCIQRIWSFNTSIAIFLWNSSSFRCPFKDVAGPKLSFPNSWDMIDQLKEVLQCKKCS